MTVVRGEGSVWPVFAVSRDALPGNCAVPVLSVGGRLVGMKRCPIVEWCIGFA